MTAPGPNPWRRSTPLVVAHRGQRATVPEQTIEAYRAAIALGCEAIECDVQLTRDGRLAMLHDLTLERTTTGHGPIAAADWADVRSLDAGSWFDARFGSCRVPSLDETIDLAVAAGIALCIEVKGLPSDTPRIAAAVVETLRRRGLLDRMFVSSFDHAALTAATPGRPETLLAPERLPESGPPDPEAAVDQARRSGATVLQHRWEDLTADVVTALHDADVAIWTWPIDSLEAIDRSVVAGADGIIGDDVALLRRGLGLPSLDTPAVRPS